MPEGAIRSIYFQLLLKDNNVQQRLEAITGAGDTATKAFQRLGDSVKGAGQRFSDFAKEHKLAFASLTASTMAALGLSLKWAGEEEAASVRTAALLKAQGIEWDNVKSSLISYFSELEKLTAYNDTDVQNAFNELIVSGVDYQTALENMEIVTRLAYGAQIDLSTAAMYVGRGIQGNSDMLARHIPAIQKLNENQRTWANVQKILNETMPESTARAKSLQGATANLSNQFQNLAEAVGTFFIPALTAVITPLASLFNWLSKIPLVPTIIGVGLLTVAFIGLAGVIAGSVIPTITSGALAILGLMGYEVAAMAPTIGLTGALGALAGAIWAVLAPLLPVIAAVAALVLIIQDLWVGFSGGDSLVLNALGNIKDSIVGFFTGLWDTFKEAGGFLINAFLMGLTGGLLNTDRLSKIFGIIGSYLPHSDAEQGPLSDLTGSGQKFTETFAKGAQLGIPLISQPLAGIANMFTGGMSTAAPAATAPISVSVSISDVHLSGGESSLKSLAMMTASEVEKTMMKILNQQAARAGI